MRFLFKLLIVWPLILIVVGAAIGAAFGWYISVPISEASLAKMKSQPQFIDGGFVNDEPPAATEFSWEMLDRQFNGTEQREPIGEIPVVSFDSGILAQEPKPGLRWTWFGHSTVLVEIDNVRFLIDPVFAERTSPFSFIGPKRFHPMPMDLDELTGIDAIVISHDHYDHYDQIVIEHLAGTDTKILVPLGLGELAYRWGAKPDQVTEFGWWEELSIGEVNFIATPARHYSNRGLFDYKKSLWLSWTIVGPEHRVFYSGDTGYAKVFTEIGERYGPFDLSVIKIGAYGPGQGWLDVHMDPESSAKVHQDVGGGIYLPVSWGTFNLAMHDWDEPIEWAMAEAEKRGITIVTPRVGETMDVDGDLGTDNWWEEVD